MVGPRSTSMRPQSWKSVLVTSVFQVTFTVTTKFQSFGSEDFNSREFFIHREVL
jgi:hypothetical protein